jgi:hypothetical protein
MSFVVGPRTKLLNHRAEQFCANCFLDDFRGANYAQKKNLKITEIEMLDDSRLLAERFVVFHESNMSCSANAFLRRV